MAELSKNKIGVSVVSAERKLHEGDADMVFVTGEVGELGIAPQHTPLLTRLKPGEVRIENNGKQEVFYISGGLLEIQPYVVTVLADTAIRADDIDEAVALEAKERAENAMKDKATDIDFNKVRIELAQAIAQVRAAKRGRKSF